MKMKKIYSIAFIFMLMFTLLPLNLNAAGSYSAYASSTTITVGSSTNLIITTNNAAGKFTVSSSNPSIASVAPSSTWVDGKMDTAITIKANAIGKATISVVPTDVSDDEYNLLNTPKYITINVVEKNNGNNNNGYWYAKSSDATLKSLTLENGTIDFKSDVFEYTVEVDKTISSLGVKAEANSSKATVTITGDENFVVGQNVVEIKVTAEDGTVKTYTINVEKSKFGKGPLTSLRVAGYTLTPEFDPSTLEYSFNATGISEVNVEYTLKDATSIVEIIGNKNLVVGNNVIQVKVTEKDGTVTVYKIKANVEAGITKSIQQGNNLIWIIIISLLAVAVVVETVVIIVKTKKKNRYEA